VEASAPGAKAAVVGMAVSTVLLLRAGGSQLSGLDIEPRWGTEPRFAAILVPIGNDAVDGGRAVMLVVHGAPVPTELLETALEEGWLVE